MKDGVEEPHFHHGDMPGKAEGGHAFVMGLEVALAGRVGRDDLLRDGLLGFELRQEKLPEEYGLVGLHRVRLHGVILKLDCGRITVNPEVARKRGYFPIGGDNRPIFLNRTNVKSLDVAQVGEMLYYLSAGFLTFKQSDFTPCLTHLLHHSFGSDLLSACCSF